MIILRAILTSNKFDVNVIASKSFDNRIPADSVIKRLCCYWRDSKQS